jgi:hypothetical protein
MICLLFSNCAEFAQIIGKNAVFCNFYSLTINGNKKHSIFHVHFSITTFFQKAKREMEFGHFSDILKMSKNENPKKVLKMTLFFDFDDNSHLYFFCEKKL